MLFRIEPKCVKCGRASTIYVMAKKSPETIVVVVVACGHCGMKMTDELASKAILADEAIEIQDEIEEEKEIDC